VLVSILISSHNYAKYLPAAIESALGQTYPEVEVIVVDDASSDESPEIIRSYGDRVRALFRERNGGPSAALNDAFAASTGELVCLLDADDMFEPQKVERVVAAARGMPDAQMIHHQVQTIDAEGRPMHAPWPRSMLSGDLRARVVQTGGWFPHPVTCGLSFRRSYLESVSPLPTQGGEHDTYLAGPAALLAPVAGIEEPLARRRKHGANRNETVTGRTPEGALANFETEAAELAKVMGRFGQSPNLSLEHHLDYQLTRRAAGQISRRRAVASVMRSPLLPAGQRVREALRVCAGRGISARR
jgi:hypothetical protein